MKHEDADSSMAASGLSRRMFLSTAGKSGVAAGIAGTIIAGGAVSSAQAAAQPVFDASFKDFLLPVFDADDSLVKVQQKGELVICTSNDWPYSFLDPQTKAFTGIDGEIIQYCARMLKIPSVRVETVPFDGMIPGLLDGRFDMVGDSIHYTAKRAKVIDFSWPTYFYAEGLVVKKGNPLGAKAIADLKGKTCGALLGTNYADWIQQADGVEFRGYKAWNEMAMDIQTGRLDGAIHDEPIVAASTVEHPDWAIELAAGYLPNQEKNPAGYSVYGFRQGDVQLNTGFRAAIMWMQANGEISKILKKWGLGSVNN